MLMYNVLFNRNTKKHLNNINLIHLIRHKSVSYGRHHIQENISLVDFTIIHTLLYNLK